MLKLSVGVLFGLCLGTHYFYIESWKRILKNLLATNHNGKSIHVLHVASSGDPLCAVGELL